MAIRSGRRAGRESGIPAGLAVGRHAECWPRRRWINSKLPSALCPKVRPFCRTPPGGGSTPEAQRHAQRLRPLSAERTLVRAELQQIFDEADTLEPELTQGRFSRSQTERLLLTYLADGEAAAWTRSALQWRDIGATYDESDDDLAGGIRVDCPEEVGIRLLQPPRSRNVFGGRVSVPSRGKRDHSSLPRGPGSTPLRMERRSDLQRAIRQLPPRARQVLFLRAVADLEFKEVAVMLDISTQAAHKAYAKALGNLTGALNGLSRSSGRSVCWENANAQAEAVRLAELAGRDEELSVAIAEYAYWERRADRMEALLGRLRPRLTQALQEAEREAAAA